jgi:putative membrane protein
MADQHVPTSNELAQERTDLAIDRTLAAHERTLIAWVRTAVSLISFGFTIYKFFDFEEKNLPQVHRLISPRGFALIMIGTGLVSLTLAIIGHAQARASIRARGTPVPRSIALIMAIFIAGLGALSFAATLFRQ